MSGAIARRGRATTVTGLVAAASAVLVLTTWMHRLGGARKVDFALYYAAARVGLTHGWAQIYVESLQRREVAAALPGPAWLPYISPPHVAWLVAPLAGLPVDVAYTVWAAIGAGTLVASAWVCSPAGRSAKALALVAGAAFLPALYSVATGQVVPLVVLSIAGSFELLRRGRPVLAGVALIGVLSKPHLALMIPVCLLAAGRVRTVIAFAAGSVGMAALTVASLGAGGLHDYLALVTLASSFADQKTLTMSGQLGTIGTAAGAALAALAVYASWRHRRGGVEIPFVVGVLASLAVARYLNAPDLTVALIPLWLLPRLNLGSLGAAAGLSTWALAEMYVFWPSPMYLAFAALITLAALQPGRPRQWASLRLRTVAEGG